MIKQRTRRPNHRGHLQSWIRLLIGLAAVMAIALGLIPWLQRIGPARQLKSFVLDRNIEATGLFYTDVESFAGAEVSVRDALDYGRSED
jgi:hypothetical protein